MFLSSMISFVVQLPAIHEYLRAQKALKIDVIKSRNFTIEEVPYEETTCTNFQNLNPIYSLVTSGGS